MKKEKKIIVEYNKNMADKIKKHKNQKILSEENMIEQEGLEKRLDPAAAALAGWWLGGEIAEYANRKPTAAQQREFERQIQQSMRKRGRRLRKESAIEKMQQFFNVKDSADTYVRKTPVKNGVKVDSILDVLQKRQNFPPRAGMRWDEGIHHWVRTDRQPGRLVEHRRFRTAYGKGSRSQVGGHGKGGQMEFVGGGRTKAAQDVAVARRLRGFTHSTPGQKIAAKRKRKGFRR